MRCLEKDPARRFATVGDLAAALGAARGRTSGVPQMLATATGPVSSVPATAPAAMTASLEPTAPRRARQREKVAGGAIAAGGRCRS